MDEQIGDKKPRHSGSGIASFVKVGGILACVFAWVGSYLAGSYLWLTVRVPDTKLVDVLEYLSYSNKMYSSIYCFGLPVLALVGLLFWYFLKRQPSTANKATLSGDIIYIITILVLSIVGGFFGGFLAIETIFCC